MSEPNFTSGNSVRIRVLLEIFVSNGCKAVTLACHSKPWHPDSANGNHLRLPVDQRTSTLKLRANRKARIVSLSSDYCLCDKGHYFVEALWAAMLLLCFLSPARCEVTSQSTLMLDVPGTQFRSTGPEDLEPLTWGTSCGDRQQFEHTSTQQPESTLFTTSTTRPRKPWKP
jgi:hypothetical protein